MMLLLKVLWRLGTSARSFLIVLLLKCLQGTLISKISWNCRVYGWITFGAVPTNVELGSGCSIGKGAFFATSKRGRIIFKDGAGINTGGHIVALEKVEVGRNTAIGEFVTIRDQNHHFADISNPIRDQGFTSRPVIIGDDVWIGRGVFVGAGVTIGEGAVIGANSVVTRDIPPYAVAVGAPARVIRTRNARE